MLYMKTLGNINSNFIKYTIFNIKHLKDGHTIPVHMYILIIWTYNMSAYETAYVNYI